MLIRTKMIALTLIVPVLCSAQKQKKSDKILLDDLETHIRYLADDKLEGRRTGTPGEKLASDYISIEFSKAGLQPKGDHNGWLGAFDIDEGRQISPDAFFSINDQPLLLNREYFPLSLSATGVVSGSPAIALQEGGLPWFIDLKDILEAGQGDAHFDLGQAIRDKITESVTKGATAAILYNSSKIRDNLRFDPRNRPEAVSIPVLYLTREGKRKYLKDESASLDIKLKTGFTEKKRTGHNVLGYWDNGAPYTVIIGAHYDHLGYGEDGNSAYKGPREIFHGADDDASGVAALIELSKLLMASRLKNNNYLFIAFSGEELQLSGSGYFVEHPDIDLSRVNYMINLDRIGRLSDSTHALILGGYGSSPAWEQVCKSADDRKYFALQVDSSTGAGTTGSTGATGGAGPIVTGADAGDHTPFYRKDIPVLCISSGWNSDYHMPTDDAGKINYPGELEVLKYIYNIIQGVNGRGRIPFNK